MKRKEEIMYEAIEAVEQVTSFVKIEKRITNLRFTKGNELFVLTTVKNGTRIKIMITIKEKENEYFVTILMKYGRIPNKELEKEVKVEYMTEKIQNLIKRIQVMELYNGDKYCATEEKVNDLIRVYELDKNEKAIIKEKFKKIFGVTTDDELEMEMFNRTFVQSVEVFENEKGEDEIKISIEIIKNDDKKREKIVADKLFGPGWNEDEIKGEYNKYKKKEQLIKKHLKEQKKRLDDKTTDGFKTGEDLTESALKYFEENKEKIKKELDE